MQPIFRSQLVWATLPANSLQPGASFPFPDQPILNGCYIAGIEALNSELLARTPDQLPVNPFYAALTLTLHDGSDKRHDQVPVSLLIPSVNFGVYKEFTPFICDWQKSRVTATSSQAIAQPYSVPFNVYYFRPEDLKLFDALMQKIG